MASTILLSADEKVQRDVLDELHWDPQVKPTDVGVEVNEGVVTLTGTVRTYRMRRAAADAVLRVYGVRGLVNKIEVNPPSIQKRTDTDIARSAAMALELDTDIPVDQIKVRCADGWITLEGSAESFYQKQAAERAVEALVGVRGVSNHIRIEPYDGTMVLPSELKDEIEKAFTRNAEIDARRIDVLLDEATVYLTGNVSSWAESREAVTAAWSTPGVKSVVNDLNVVP